MSVDGGFDGIEWVTQHDLETATQEAVEEAVQKAQDMIDDYECDHECEHECEVLEYEFEGVRDQARALQTLVNAQQAVLLDLKTEMAELESKSKEREERMLAYHQDLTAVFDDPVAKMRDAQQLEIQQKNQLDISQLMSRLKFLEDAEARRNRLGDRVSKKHRRPMRQLSKSISLPLSPKAEFDGEFRCRMRLAVYSLPNNGQA